MRVVDFCKNYFSPFASRDANGKKFNPKNTVVTLKIVSYIFIPIPATIGAIYGIATLVNRVRTVGNLPPESIEKNVDSASRSLRPSVVTSKYDRLTAQFISRIERVKKNEPELIKLMQEACFELPANRFMQFFKELGFTAKPLYVLEVQNDRIVFKPNGEPLKAGVEKNWAPKEGSLLRELYGLLEFNPDLLCYCGSKHVDQTINLDLYHLLLGPDGCHSDPSLLHRLTRKFHSGVSSLYMYYRGETQAHKEEVATYLRQHPSKSALVASPLDLFFLNTERAKGIIRRYEEVLQRGEPSEPLSSKEEVIEKLKNDPTFLDMPDAFLNNAQFMKGLLGEMNLGKFAYFLRRSTLYDDQDFIWGLMQEEPELIAELGYGGFDAAHQLEAIRLNRQQIHYWPNESSSWIKERADRVEKKETPTKMDQCLTEYEKNEGKGILIFQWASRTRSFY